MFELSSYYIIIGKKLKLNEINFLCALAVYITKCLQYDYTLESCVIKNKKKRIVFMIKYVIHFIKT